jgi:hypothetical protein
VIDREGRARRLGNSGWHRVVRVVEYQAEGERKGARARQTKTKQREKLDSIDRVRPPVLKYIREGATMKKMSRHVGH